MAGQPDKTGKRTELTIGLYECYGKTFRTTVSKKKSQYVEESNITPLFFILLARAIRG